MPRIYLAGIILTLIAHQLSGCAGTSRLDSIDAGRTLVYETGLPDFDMEVLESMQEGQAFVNVFISIPKASLVFENEGDAYVASFDVIYRLLDRRGRHIIAEDTDTDSVHINEYDDTQSYRPVHFTKSLPVTPGQFVVEVSITDVRSNKSAIRRQGITIEEPEASTPSLSRIQLQGLRPGERIEPIVSLYVPAGLDTLRTYAELFRMQEDDSLEISMVLLKLSSDTIVAYPPYWLSPMRGSLYYRGVNYRDADTMQVSRRQISGLDGEVEVIFSLPPLLEGIYRIELEANGESPRNREGYELRQERQFLVANPAFPEIETLDQMIDALVYIAYERELAHIRDGTTWEAKKARFDAFWGSLVSSRAVAANLLKLYYSRVEEANRLFTSHKEGWKTDRGMLFIVFGPPTYIENEIDGEIWHYSNSSSYVDPLNTFAFERVRSVSPDEPFVNFVLLRRAMYEQIWSRAVDRWRDGVVL